MLTSEIPFLDTYQDPEDSGVFVSDFDMESVSDPCASMSMDMALLLDYCRDMIPFPTESLQKSGVDEDGIGFVRSLMVAQPHGRVSAAEALESVWLGGTGVPTPPVIPIK